MTKAKDISEIQEFITACENMINSKYILIDKRLSDLLKSIAKCKPVFNYIAECMINFNFDREWNASCSKPGKIRLPEETHKQVAFIFCLLNNIDDKKLNINDLLSKHFSYDENGIGAYSLFLTTIIEPFKIILVSSLIDEPKPEKPVHYEEETIVVSPDTKARLDFLARDLKTYFMGIKKLKTRTATKAEIVMLSNSLINAINQGDTQYLEPIIVAIRVCVERDKEPTRRLLELQRILTSCVVEK